MADVDEQDVEILRKFLKFAHQLAKQTCLLQNALWDWRFYDTSK